MKLRLNKTMNLCLIATALLVSACGKKENKVSSATSNSSPFYTGNPALSGSAGSTIISQVQSIKTNVPCNGGYRLTNDVSFYVNGGYVGSNKIGGIFEPGFHVNANSQINKLWVGVSAFRDLMFVTQVTNGSQVVGFNVTMSFCEMKNYATGFPSLVSNERALTRFTARNGIIVDSNTYCGYGVVDFAYMTEIISERGLSNPYSDRDITIQTSFTKPTCNGQF